MTLAATPKPPAPTPRRRPFWHTVGRTLWRSLCYAVVVGILLIFAAAVILWYTYQNHFKPSPDEWTYTIHASSYSVPISIPKTIVFFTSPQIAPWLTWIQKDTRIGTLQLGWDKTSQSLHITCAPCTTPKAESVGLSTIVLEQIQLRIHQLTPQTFSGAISIVSASTQTPPILIPWEGTLTPQTLHIQTQAHDISIASIFQTLVPNLEELQRANITGTLSFEGNLSLPSLSSQVTNLQVNNFTVSGLGTEALLNTTSSCSEPSNLPMNSWLVRSVISAEDQRFENHPGYDLEELIPVLNANHSSGTIIRGGSTITQQTAKILFTGSQRTLTRKLRELLYAVEMEQTLGKTRIMQLYLDNAPWGIYANGRILCGAQSAAQHYFHVDANKLTPEQAIWLASMLHSPVSEARNWQRTGRINLRRAVWVAEYIRNAPNSGPRARQNIINRLRANPSLGVQAQPETPSPSN